MVLGLFFGALVTAMLFYAQGIGETLLYRERLDDAADSGAFAGAAIYARGMNVLSLYNTASAAMVSVSVASQSVASLIQYGAAYAAVRCSMCSGGCRACRDAESLARKGAQSLAYVTAQQAQLQIAIPNAASTVTILSNTLPQAARLQVRQLAFEQASSIQAGYLQTTGLPVVRELPTPQMSVYCGKVEEQATRLVKKRGFEKETRKKVRKYIERFLGSYDRVEETVIRQLTWAQCTGRGVRAALPGLGEEPYQVRAVMRAREPTPFARHERAVAVASWRDRPNVQTEMRKLEQKAAFGVAQAEVYLDRTIDLREALYTVDWRARLRRLQVPGRALSTACVMELGGAFCQGIQGIEELVNRAGVH